MAEQEAENTKFIIEQVITTAPLALLSIKDENIINQINNYLPFSIGMEFECNKGIAYNEYNFTSIPDILDVNVDDDEQRYRIPSGIKGFMCLYNICTQLAFNSTMNAGSGIHYHVDMTDCFKSLTKEFVKENEEFILTELDSWDYTRSYNARACKIDTRCWVNFQSGFKTAEIRIGHMSFDYEYIVKKIIHACNIIRELKKRLGYEVILPEAKPLDAETIVNYIENHTQEFVCEAEVEILEQELLKLEEEKVVIQSEEMNRVVNSRIIRI